MVVLLVSRGGLGSVGAVGSGVGGVAEKHARADHTDDGVGGRFGL
jgi:hypothetical protein